MMVSGLNKIINCCVVISNGARYTCPTKLINGELCFHFKKQWHKVAEYAAEHLEELVQEGGSVFSRPFTK